jgi:tRNA dimethylallyltransferase
MLSRPLISIVGPTATGKSGFAFALADRLLLEGYFSSVAIISADSRQVYRGLEIVSGADVPAEFELAVAELDQPYTHFVKKTIYGEVQLHGVSIIEPTTEWSLAAFQQFALGVINRTWQHGGLPIVVGGTGLYHARLFAPELAELAGPDEQLRQQVAELSLTELQQLVTEQWPAEYAALTRDDQHNPRRLIRLLEKKQAASKTQLSAQLEVVQPTLHLTLGLTDTIEHIEQKIAQRVAERLNLGAIGEVQTLLAQVGTQDLLVLSATGVKELSLLVQEKIDLDQCRELWVKRERQYAKRQQTWWKKNSAGIWFDVSQTNWQAEAQNQVLASF